MSSASLNKADLKRLNNKLQKLKKYSEQELSKELGFSASQMQLQMVRSAPVAQSGLKNSISLDRTGKNSIGIKAAKNYAPYVEFGTGNKVDLSDLKGLGIPESYAMQFKGKGIREVNLPARPFFFSSVRKELPKMLSRIENTLKKLTR